MKEIKTILTLTLTLISMISVFGQNDSCTFRIDSLTNEKIYTTVNQPPTLGETEKETFEYIAKHFKYPQHYRGNELLIASFIVQEDGTIDKIEIIKKSNFELANRNLLELIESMPKWEPGYCNSKAVKTEYRLPLRIKL